MSRGAVLRRQLEIEMVVAVRDMLGVDHVADYRHHRDLAKNFVRVAEWYAAEAVAQARGGRPA